MLDPDCGLCYKLNKSSIVESSCVPVDKDSTMKAAWGRYVTGQDFLALCSTESVFYAVENSFAFTKNVTLKMFGKKKITWHCQKWVITF